ncbi:MAG: IS66 family insertion sequence element accessory protein TnpB [Bacteroidaceae bacterium]|nr:IS66 family insertion sequence element accessory protein TnpB [Bacteroidaceae bacterium]
MFELNENNRYFLCIYPMRFNYGIDGLYNMVATNTHLSPMTGDAFVFFNKPRNMVKILKWDTDGFLLYQKRLAKGRFELPRYSEDSGCFELSWDTFYFIIKGVNLAAVKYHNRFKYRALQGNI